MDDTEIIEIGLKLLTLPLSPDFKIGTILATLFMFGNIPKDTDLLNKLHIKLVIFSLQVVCINVGKENI